jgi:hypothetical protein
MDNDQAELKRFQALLESEIAIDLSAEEAARVIGHLEQVTLGFVDIHSLKQPIWFVFTNKASVRAYRILGATVRGLPVRELPQAEIPEEDETYVIWDADGTVIPLASDGEAQSH